MSEELEEKQPICGALPNDSELAEMKAACYADVEDKAQSQAIPVDVVGRTRIWLPPGWGMSIR